MWLQVRARPKLQTKEEKCLVYDFFLYPLIREQTKPTVKPDKEVNKKLGLNASPVEKDDITLKHHTIVIAQKVDNNGAKI